MTSKDRVLDVAESLFNRHGYAGVSVHDIAAALKMKTASLYYHAPDGKRGLYRAVAERRMAVLQRCVERALEGEEPFEARLHRLALALIDHAPIGLHRMLMSDLAELPKAHNKELRRKVYDAVLLPIKRAVDRAIAGGELRPFAAELLGSGLIAALDGIWYAAEVEKVPVPKALMVKEWVDLICLGIRPR